MCEEALVISNKYRRLEQIGNGTYGTVYKGLDLNERKIVALKRMETDAGVHKHEIEVLVAMDHPNVVKIVHYAFIKNDVYIIMEYIDSDLRSFLTLNAPLSPPQIHSIMYQLLSATAYCHKMGVMHRDIKPQNILISKQGYVKLADFGLSCLIKNDPYATYTPGATTIWYRAPELLLCGGYYDAAVDIWSIGCVFAELSNGGFPIFPGDGEIDQLVRIFRHVGTPTDDTWPGFSNFARALIFPIFNNTLNHLHMPENDLCILTTMLVCNPRNRISATDAITMLRRRVA
jgi:serine/threonine protein kinase